MDALTPQPSPELPTVLPAADVAVPPPAPQGPRCALCGELAADNQGVNWQRRLTDDELTEHVRLEQERRDQAVLLADPQLPAPAFPPLPDGSNDTHLVVACGPHAIRMDAAGLIHQATCTAPNEDHLPDCDCTPEPAPQTVEEPEPAPNLPAHWR